MESAVGLVLVGSRSGSQRALSLENLRVLLRQVPLYLLHCELSVSIRVLTKAHSWHIAGNIPRVGSVQTEESCD